MDEQYVSDIVFWWEQGLVRCLPGSGTWRWFREPDGPACELREPFACSAHNGSDRPSGPLGTYRIDRKMPRIKVLWFEEKIETMFKSMTTILTFHYPTPRKALWNVNDYAIVDPMREQRRELSSRIVTRIIWFREYHFAQRKRAIFRKSRPVLMISGHCHLKKFAKHIHRGPYNILQFLGRAFLKSRFSL
jgi:hypothetical protein